MLWFCFEFGNTDDRDVNTPPADIEEDAIEEEIPEREFQRVAEGREWSVGTREVAALMIFRDTFTLTFWC